MLCLCLQGRCMLTFGKTVDAVRFCHAAQTNILFHRWPPEALDMCGPIEHTPDGRLLFRGPRVAMAVHETDIYEYAAVAVRMYVGACCSRKGCGCA